MLASDDTRSDLMGAEAFAMDWRLEDEAFSIERAMSSDCVSAGGPCWDCEDRSDSDLSSSLEIILKDSCQ